VTAFERPVDLAKQIPPHWLTPSQDTRYPLTPHLPPLPVSADHCNVTSNTRGSMFLRFSLPRFSDLLSSPAGSWWARPFRHRRLPRFFPPNGRGPAVPSQPHQRPSFVRSFCSPFASSPSLFDLWSLHRSQSPFRTFSDQNTFFKDLRPPRSLNCPTLLTKVTCQLLPFPRCTGTEGVSVLLFPPLLLLED